MLLSGLKMKILFSKQAIKFIEKIELKEKNKILHKISKVLKNIRINGYLKNEDLDIKVLRGEWYPAKRLRIGSYRVIFHIDRDKDQLQVLVIDNRGDIY